MDRETGVVVVAAGHGALRPGVTKLIEEIDGEPMLARVIAAARLADIGPIVLVVTPRFRGRIERSLDASLEGVTIVEQPARRGAADAVRYALPPLRALGCRSLLSVFADMPCWRPETFREFVLAHRASGARITMALLRAGDVAGRGGFEDFGRALVDASGRVVDTFEPRERKPSEEELAAAGFLNPALYAIDLDLFAEYVDRIPPYPRTDGFPDELHLPALVKVVGDAGIGVGTYVVRDVEQARGVNTLKELALLQGRFASRVAAVAEATSAP